MGPPLSVNDYERLAEEVLPTEWYGYFAGGACDERTLRENVEAFARVRLRPRVLAGAGEVSTAATALGTDVSMPILVAPVGYQRLAHAHGEEGMARAAQAAGTVMCVSTLATATFAEIAAAVPDASLFFQVYPFVDRGVTADIVAEALESGARALLLTADLAVVGKRERERRVGWALPEDVVPSVRIARARGFDGRAEALMDASLDWAYLEELCASAPVPVVVKGVLTAEDAVLAAEHGAAGVVVSNHGARQLDGVVPALEALPEVVGAAGDRIEVWMDGGVRRGTDVAAALALGARGVLVGRAPLWGLAAGGSDGALAVLEVLREELEIALILLGCRSPADVTHAHVSTVGFP